MEAFVWSTVGTSCRFVAACQASLSRKLDTPQNGGKETESLEADVVLRGFVLACCKAGGLDIHRVRTRDIPSSPAPNEAPSVEALTLS